MKIDDLTEAQLKLLASFYESETYKLLEQLSLGIKNSNASMMVVELENSKSDFEAIKNVLKRTYLSAGMLDLLHISKTCKDKLEKNVDKKEK